MRLPTVRSAPPPSLTLFVRLATGYIDLSKRRVSPEDVIKCEERYNKSKTVHTIVRHVAEKTGKDMDEIMELVAWPLYKKYGHAFEAFKLSIRCVAVARSGCSSDRLTRLVSPTSSEPETVFADMDIPEDIYSELRVNIARRLTPQPVKVRADIEVTNFSYNGILTIQEALAAGESLSTEEIPIKIRLVAPPLYVMVTNTTDKQGAIERLEQAIEKIGEVIKREDGGFLNVKMKPKAVSETDDLELAALMDRVARENKEVSGEFARSISPDPSTFLPLYADVRCDLRDSQATRTRTASRRLVPFFTPLFLPRTLALSLPLRPLLLHLTPCCPEFLAMHPPRRV